MIRKIVSGGQTGADRAALDAGRTLGLETGGWVPRGRRAEDGVVPEAYDTLVESDSPEYACRTELNVRDSDATLVLCFGAPSGGTAQTIEFAVALERPHLVVDLERLPVARAAEVLRRWLEENRPAVLNVAGPRASKEPRIGEATRAVLLRALRAGGGDPV